MELITDDYKHFLQNLKQRIASAQIKAAVAVNHELIMIYWQIGREILDQQNTQGWGGKVIDQLSKDLRTTFPEMKGFSPRNLKYMRRFAEVWNNDEFVQQFAAQIPWFHNCTILDKTNSIEEHEFYIRKTIEEGLSRNVLVWQIENKLFERQGKAITNFESTLPKTQSELATQILKDPYNFDFLSLHNIAVERDLENALLENIRKFLLELGVGFAFVGSQYHLEIGDQDFYLNLLFYHLKLRSFVVIDLKMGEFKPEFAGKMNFYLSAVDDLLKHEKDEPSIGLILCKSKNRFIAEYALRDLQKPIGVSEMQLMEKLPDKLQGDLPTIEEIEKTASELMAERVNKAKINKKDFLQVIKEREKLGNMDFSMEQYVPILSNIFEKDKADERIAVLFRLEALAKLIDKEDLPEEWVSTSDQASVSIIEPVFLVAATHPLVIEDNDLLFERNSFFKEVQEILKSENEQ